MNGSRARIVVFVQLMLVLVGVGCDKACQDAIVQGVVGIASIKLHLVRIAGSQFIDLAKADSGDGYVAQGGYLCVTHNPGCGWIGNSGTDQFFSAAKPLPLLSTVVAVYFDQLWPIGINSASGGGTIGGWGSYGASVTGSPSSGYHVSWKNACQGDFGGKNLYYRISFVLSVPEGTDLGAEMVDQTATAVGCRPENYSDNPQIGTVTPGVAAASGFAGRVDYCNITDATASGTLHLEATCLTPVPGAQGSSTMKVDIPVSFPPSGGGVPSSVPFSTGLSFKQGTWQITKAQVVGLTGQLPGLPITVSLPGGLGTPDLDFTAGTGCQRR